MIVCLVLSCLGPDTLLVLTERRCNRGGPTALTTAIGLNARIAEARHEPPPPFGAVPPLPPVLEERFIEALIPQVERWRRVFAEARPQREAKRRMFQELDDSHGDRYGKGREWLREWDRERAELRERYEGWEKKWQRDYAE